MSQVRSADPSSQRHPSSPTTHRPLAGGYGAAIREEPLCGLRGGFRPRSCDSERCHFPKDADQRPHHLHYNSGQRPHHFHDNADDFHHGLRHSCHYEQKKSSQSHNGQNDTFQLQSVPLSHGRIFGHCRLRAWPACSPLARVCPVSAGRAISVYPTVPHPLGATEPNEPSHLLSGSLESSAVTRCLVVYRSDMRTEVFRPVVPRYWCYSALVLPRRPLPRGTEPLPSSQK